MDWLEIEKSIERVTHEAFQVITARSIGGGSINSAYRLEGKNYSQAEWFKAVCEKSIYISDVFLGYRNTPHFIIAVKKMEDGEPWYLRATIDTQFFNNLVENIRVGKTGEAYLTNKDGVLQTRKRSGASLMSIDPDFA